MLVCTVASDGEMHEGPTAPARTRGVDELYTEARPTLNVCSDRIWIELEVGANFSSPAVSKRAMKQLSGCRIDLVPVLSGA